MPDDAESGTKSPTCDGLPVRRGDVVHRRRRGGLWWTEGRANERTDGWAGRHHWPGLSSIARRNGIAGVRRASGRSTGPDGQTPPLYTEKKVGLAWQIDTCHGVNKVSNGIEGHGVADVRGANLNSGKEPGKRINLISEIQFELIIRE